MSTPEPNRADLQYRQVSMREIAVGVLLFLALIPSLALLPYRFPPDAHAASAAAAVGYNNRVAYGLAVGIAIFATAIFAAGGRLGWLGRADGNPETRPSKSKSIRWSISRGQAVEIAVVFVLTFLLYCPFFLPRYGPYIEDSYALTAVYRVNHQMPYADFDFPYGPAMYFTIYGWTRLFGYSMKSYYALIALAEAIEYSLLAYAVQRLYPRRRSQVFTFSIIAALVFNSLLALNYHGGRKLLPVVIIAIFALRPRSRAALIAGASLLGFLLAYSHEFGVATATAIAAIEVLLFLAERSAARLVRLAFAGAISGAVWLGISYALLRDKFPDYLRATLSEIHRYNAGEMAFAFYWTVNSLVAFAFFILVCAIVGKGLTRIRAQEPAAGDLYLWGAFAYTFVAMRSGLQRADMWHLVPPFIALFMAFLLPLPRRIFTTMAATHRLAMLCITVVAATYLFALAPTASYFIRGNYVGMRDVLTGVSAPTAHPNVTRQPSIEFERSHPDPDLVAAGAFLAAPEQQRRPVFLYGRTWSFDKRIGIVKTTYATDDFFLEESWGVKYRHQLEEEPDSLVVIETNEFRRLFGLVDRQQNTGPRDYYEGSFVKTVSGWLATVHYSATPVELKVKEQRWEETIGGFVREHYTVLRQFGFVTVLERKNPL